MESNNFNEVINYVNTESVCHLCLKECDAEKLLPIIGENLKQEPEYKVFEMSVADFIFFITSQQEINIMEDGTQELPRYMCELCADIVESFMEFRLECIRSIDTLQKIKSSILEDNVEIIEMVVEGDEKNYDDEDLKLEIEQFGDNIIEVETVEDQEIDVDSYISDSMMVYSTVKNELTKEDSNSVEEHQSDNEHDFTGDLETPDTSTDSPSRKRNSEKFVLTMDGDLITDQSDYEPSVIEDDAKEPEKKKRKNQPYKHKMDLCHICGDFKAMLYNHVHLVHNENRPYTCLYCPKTFRQISHKNRHHRTHFNDRPYKCDECPKAFYDCASLKKHKQGHAGIRQYVCSICSNAFVYASVLKKHVATHLQDRQFECQECGKKFLTRTEHKQHMMIHTGEKPFECRLCEKRFRTSGMRRIHEMNVHQIKRSASNTIKVKSD